MKCKHLPRQTIARLACVIIALCFIILSASLLSGCSESTTTKTTYAYIYLPDGEIVEGRVTKKSYWSYGVFQLEIDGLTYITHSSNVMLITK